MELADKKGISTDHIDFYRVDLAMSFEIFKIVNQIFITLDVLRRVTLEIIEDYTKHNCVYLELRSTPKAFGDKTMKEYM